MYRSKTTNKYDKFIEYLYDDLVHESVVEYLNTVANESNFIEQKRDIRLIEEWIKYIGDYVIGLKKNNFLNPSNITTALDNLQTIPDITPTPKYLRGIFGVTNPNTNAIKINPELTGSKFLSAQERTRLYTYHELGHILHNPMIKSAKKYTSRLRTNPNFLALNPTSNAMADILDGFNCLDEVTTQELAETLVYQNSKKARPRINYVFDKGKIPMYSGKEYKTNFDYYGQLEEPVICFGRVLNEMGLINGTTDEEIITELSKKTLNPNFTETLLNEFSKDAFLERSFLLVMMGLGKLKDASYVRFGAGHNAENLKNSDKTFENVKQVCDIMKRHVAESKQQTTIQTFRRF